MVKGIKNLSYVAGGGKGLLSYTVGDMLRIAASKWGQQDGVSSVHEGVTWTYSELLQRSESIAKGLVSLGLPKQARVGIYAPNCKEWLLAQMATSLADLILVSINPASQAFELEHAIKKVDVSALIMTPGFRHSDYIELLTKIDPAMGNRVSTTLELPNLPSLKHIIIIGSRKEPGTIPFHDLYHMESSEYKDRTRTVGFNDPTNILFTSGSRDRPKAATLSHFNVVNNGYYVADTLKYTYRDRVAIPVPLYHCFGMVVGNLACISHGATMVYPDFSFSAASTINAVIKEKCTSLYGVPTMFRALVKEQQKEKKDMSTLRTGVVLGSICPPDLMKQVVNVLGINGITSCYGLTETSPVSFQTRLNDDLDKRVSTVGTVHPHVECQIINSKGEIVERGTVGEICIRGYSVMKGYWGDEKATNDTIDPDRWMLTEDQGVLDDKGYLKIVGHLKDMIVRGGENIYPSEVEIFLGTHPDIEEVHVFGVSDEFYGEQVAAWIKMKSGKKALTLKEIQEFCKGNIAYFKIPKVFKVVESFPVTATGNVMKYKMREEHEASK
ncbi:hypothetical protein SteCoe_5152 [Stentor coeruleus]|uniref:AMP-dependent synthetase/ligase domain-containing protein n=1 Tax=Stentor coeruleus TaxID=5963 RepID=A0A1R2CT31_9CILI|nr:hypothetical protein SteCoe_5152 [Stentor coeruleus]